MSNIAYFRIVQSLFLKKIVYSSFILMTVLCFSSNSKAKEDSFIGFYNGSKMELMFHLYLLPNHEFVINLSYGSEDRVILGSWIQIEKNKIHLTEIRDQDDSFFVYAAEGSGTSRKIEFRSFDENTYNALAFGEIFNRKALRYILKPDENNFYYTYDLDKSVASSKKIYLSRSISQDKHEVYEFEPKDNNHNVLLIYNRLIDKPLFTLDAVLKDDVLFTVDDMESQPLGKKQLLPKNIMFQLSEVKKLHQIPDQLMSEKDGKPIKYKRLFPIKKFTTIMKLNPQESYFGSEKIEISKIMYGQ
ncbi:hypothetical protein F4V57_02225 [Acinetobacter qingfengensis]|uniref:DUF3108 domain-containing protein n=1 Tax=Acinetobacter qingfengensis TaxID=1262585 RepID=A0A1E7REU5_9GAMM|nr:hypothetical protein [Acinetobacter qingfengensis]KAA8735630.1 hypothetical protein F4V57_02225 [Acinetobacter qingfengensis]OEY97920.1 hypothetical protein BJI46_07595 [Acinetobacter qingfengensis]